MNDTAPFLDNPGAFPVRDGCRVTPLIEAADMYPALEELVLAAERTVWLAFRIFDPDTAARSPAAVAHDLADWTAIIRHVIERGVTVRLLLADFEPVMADHLHGGSWATFTTLRAMAADLEPAARDRLEIIVIQHEGELGYGLRQLLRLVVGFRVRAVLRDLASDHADVGKALAVRPGLWPHYRMRDGRPAYRRGPAPRLWPATYHQKFAVIDDRVAIVGGLDVDERRWDDKRHRRRADQTWHDLSVKLEGPAVGDAATHFATCWNEELPRFRTIVADWTSAGDRELALDPLKSVPRPEHPAAIAGGIARVQCLRTRSRRNGRWFAAGPSPHITELMEAHRRLIFSAERVLYIEAQFFRFRLAASWIIARARVARDLQVIVVLPNAPEEVAFDGDRRAPHRHGEWLQVESLSRLKRKLGDRIGFFALAKPQRATPEERRHTADRGTAYGAGTIHVHAKLMIADDRLALVSSANINGRSFRWDTEFGVLWEDATGVAAMRRQAWVQLLADETIAGIPLEDGLARWRDAAAANLALAPEERRGFVVPHQLGKARRFARPAWFVPDDLV